MKDVKELYFKESDKLDSLVKINIEVYEKAEDKNYIVYDGKVFEVIEEKPEDAEVFGYVSVASKENKNEKIKLEDVKSTIENRVAIKKDKGNQKIVGYTWLNDETLVALVEKKTNLLLILLPLLILFLGIGIFMFNPISNRDDVQQTEDKKPVFKDGEKGTGEIGKETVEFAEQPMFRMKLNCTPTVENGEMNIRVESPAEENADYGFVVKVYALQEVDTEGNVINDLYDEPVQIYESPLIFANENIEYCELDQMIESGTYIGRATYDVYDLEQNFIGQTAAKLMIKVL